MIFSVSNDGIQWTLDFGPDSGFIAVNDLDQNITTSSQEIPLAALHLLLPQRQDFLNNHLARVPITHNLEGTIEMREEVVFNEGAQDLDTSSYQVSDIEDIAFNWEGSQLDMDSVFRPSIEPPFSPTTIDDLLMGDGSVENPICVGRRGIQGECSSSNNTRVCQTHGTSQVAEKSRFWSKNGKCARLCF